MMLTELALCLTVAVCDAENQEIELTPTRQQAKGIGSIRKERTCFPVCHPRSTEVQSVTNSGGE